MKLIKILTKPILKNSRINLLFIFIVFIGLNAFDYFTNNSINFDSNIIFAITLSFLIYLFEQLILVLINKFINRR